MAVKHIPSIAHIKCNPIFQDSIIRTFFLLPNSARSPKKFRIPATFRSGSCEIEVVYHHTKPFDIEPRLPNVASVSYFKIWPEAGQATENIIKECFPATRTGYNTGWEYVTIVTSTHPRELKALFAVSVRSGQPMKDDPLLSYPDIEHFTYYESDGLGKEVRVTGPTSRT